MGGEWGGGAPLSSERRLARCTGKPLLSYCINTAIAAWLPLSGREGEEGGGGCAGMRQLLLL